MTEDVLAAIERARVLPLVVFDDAADAAPTARALLDGGVPCLEIALRSPSAVDAIERAAGVEGVLVGAGTVLDPDAVDRCVDAGARFIVSPGLDPDVVRRAAERGVPAVPGVATASEVQAALRLGLSRLKLFPASVLGGRAVVDALHGPFPDVRFLPSGGVSEQNAEEYLASPAVFAVSGSWLAPRDVIAAGRFADITAACRRLHERDGA